MRTFIFGLLLPFVLCADELHVDLPNLWDQKCESCIPCFAQVEARLRNPLYKGGVLTTEEGGVLVGRQIRIQARHIAYTKEPNRTPPLCNVYCEGDLLIDFKGWTLSADAIFYDFITETGYLLNGRTASPPWYIGGKEMCIDSNGELIVRDGYITTSEGKDQRDVQVLARKLILTKNRIASASNVQVRLLNTPLLWLPKMKLNLKKLSRSPFGIRFGWGRFMDPYLSVVYNFLDWNDLKAMARIDGFFRHGVGMGIDTQFDPQNSKAAFYTRNYWVHDLAIDDPQKRNRWRYQGTYANRHWEDSLILKAQYDFVSDGQMAYTYRTKDFDLKTAGATKFDIRKKDPNYLANLLGVVQVNRFQSVNQHLPSFLFNLHPIEFPTTGLVLEADFSASYLNYVFSQDVTPITNFNGGRFSATPTLYRPISLKPVTVTPLVGLIGIYYSNSPDSGGAVGQAVGKFGVSAESSLFQTFGHVKHVMEPYIHYTYLTEPTVPLGEHYLYSIDDGLNRLNQLRFGMEHSFYTKKSCIERKFWFDVWANAFFSQNALPVSIPTGFFDCEYKPIPPLSFALNSGYSFAYHNPYYLNTSLDWTFSENFAMGIGYRGRSKYYIRKADFYNFIIDVTRPAEELDASALSDKRQTFLFRTFVRPIPDFTAKFDLRYGWDRIDQDPYMEYRLDLGTILFQHWAFNFVLEHNESAMRYSFSLKIPPPPPSR